MSRQRILTDEQAMQCRLLYESGKTIRDLARQHGVSCGVITRAIRSAGAVIRPGARRPLLTDEEAVQCRTLYESGCALKSLAQRFGVEKSVICRAIRRTGGKMRHSPESPRLSDPQARQCRALYEAGKTLQEIAQRFGVKSRTTIASAIKRVGGTIRPTGHSKIKSATEQDMLFRRLHESGASTFSIAREYDIAPKTICAAIRRAGGVVRSDFTKRRFTDDEEKELCRLYDCEHISTQELATRFDCTVATIRRALHRAGSNIHQGRKPSRANKETHG